MKDRYGGEEPAIGGSLGSLEDLAGIFNSEYRTSTTIHGETTKHTESVKMPKEFSSIFIVPRPWGYRHGWDLPCPQTLNPFCLSTSIANFPPPSNPPSGLNFFLGSQRLKQFEPFTLSYRPTCGTHPKPLTPQDLEFEAKRQI